LYGICFYGFRESEKTESLYGHVDYLEPVYGIILAYFIGGKRKMSFSFYVGAVIIIITVILNGIIKHKAGKK
jgi:drug/metabolite transporter (DMT)-like permease